MNNQFQYTNELAISLTNIPVVPRQVIPYFNENILHNLPTKYFIKKIRQRKYLILWRFARVCSCIWISSSDFLTNDFVCWMWISIVPEGINAGKADTAFAETHNLKYNKSSF